jgi:hypothetical protein
MAASERQRQRQPNDPPLLSERAEAGELPVLPWKGGVDVPTKLGHKYGTVQYLAMWQGLRCEDLNVSLDEEVTLICSKTQMKVTYTAEYAKYANA